MDIANQQLYHITFDEKEMRTLQLLYERLFALTHDEDAEFCLTQDEYVLLNKMFLSE